MIKSTILFQINAVRRNLLTFLVIALTAVVVLYIGYRHGAFVNGIAYLFVMWLCSFFIDFYALLRPAKNDFEVRNPKKETKVFFLCILGAILFFIFRFSGILDWNHTANAIRLAIALLIIFVFPIALAGILLLMKYKPKELGIRFQGFLVIIPIIAISAITNRIISPDSLTWDKVLEESGGVVGAIFTGFITAGLSEEFFRFVGMTRLGAMLGNKGYAWFITTVIWAAMHFPNWYSEDHHFMEPMLGSIRIIPIGLMWGYITHRTKSILPATLVHGTNFWGLQNF